jgi:hypothetical protein
LYIFNSKKNRFLWYSQTIVRTVGAVRTSTDAKEVKKMSETQQHGSSKELKQQTPNHTPGVNNSA